MAGDALEQQLRTAEAAKEGEYDKRTEHLDAQGNAIFINRLVLEDSPYLLQHAHNPVNWYPWGSEAFEAAEAEDKPVFLSIGYSTCHWCHVMEVESFDNVEVAKVLNEHFISVKMDREQYPDLDEIYMTGVQLMTGQGGWPMSNFLLPDGRPFFGATYFPPPSFLDLLHKVQAAWQTQRGELENSAASIDSAIGKLLVNRSPAVELSDELIARAAQELLDRQDLSFGGIAGAPKFPQEPLLMFLLDYALRERDTRCMAMVVNALRAMAMGGIYDQVGGGFHRYSVDELWLVPHFEKMLYNQSQLSQLYLEAWLLTGDEFFKRVLTQTLNYVLREMQIPGGGFYSATDADSEGVEGTFFVWQRQELVDGLSEDEFALANKVFDITEQGNFEGANILKLQHSLDYLARESAQSDAEFLSRLDALLVKLYELREQREPPIRDDKLIVGWNGAMINALAKAAWHCKEDTWLQAAEKAAAFILQNNLRDDGALYRIALNGTCSIAGQLEDYANLVQCLITLFDVTEKSSYLQQAVDLADQVRVRFYDSDQSALFLSPTEQEGPQLVRSANAGDGATLSPIGSMLDCWQKLAQRCARLDECENEDYTQLITAVLNTQSGAVQEQAISHSSLLRTAQESRQALNYGIAYAGNGLLRVAADSLDAESVLLRFSLQEHWHIAMQTAGNEESERANTKPAFPRVEVAIEDSDWMIDTLTLPSAYERVQLSASEQIDVYSGEFECRVRLQARSQHQLFCGVVHLRLAVQLCTEGRCLLPETLELIAPLHS